MRRFLLALVGTAAALAALLSFKSHTVTLAAPPAAIGTPLPTGSDPTASTPTTAAPAAGTSSSASAAPSSSSASGGTRTVTGDSVDTRWGPVQVQITVTAGKVTAAKAVVYPENNPRDQEINAYAIPTLEQETVSAGTSAQIDSVSGATYTSDGYEQSLQSALDKAGL